MKIYTLFFLSILLASCKSTAVQKPKEIVCVSFDIRQCQTDLFAEAVPQTDSKESREEKMLSWLKSQNLPVLDVNLYLNYHDSTCEACDTCPSYDRYFITLEGLRPDAKALRLLNMAEYDC